MPGSASSSSIEAELRLGRAAGDFPTAPGTRRGTSTCIPSARTGDRVSDSFALCQPVQPRLPNGARDVDDELGRRRALGNERGCRLNRGRTRAGQRAPGHREEGKGNRGENERPLARHGQGGHVPSVPGEPSRRANASVPIVCRFS